MITPDLRTEPRTVMLGRRDVKLAVAGLCALVMVALQACTTTSMPEPKYPIYMQDKPAEAVPAQDTPDNTPAPAPYTPAVTTPSPSGTVTTTDLAPPPPPPPPPEDADYTSTSGGTTTTTPKPSPSKPVAAKPSSSNAAAPVSAPVRDTRAGFVYVLQAHDTLYGVSRRFGVPIRELYDINGLSETASLRIGQRIVLPVTASDKGVEEHANGAGMVKLAAALTPSKPAPAAPVKAPATTPAKPPVTAHVTPPAKPVVTTTTTTVTTVTPPAKPAVAPPVTATVTPPVVRPPVAPAPVIAGFPGNSQISQMGRGLFVWPVKGKILVPFGQLAPNVRNDGINIQASSGTEIRAASDGIVVYEGDQVKELGNTVYIKHANGWYTGYSHMATMSVKNNERVTRGQVIGTVGQTGVIDQPQLHFEIRYTPSTDIARPVDPNLVLP